MFVKLRRIISVLGILGILARCNPAVPIDSGTVTPSTTTDIGTSTQATRTPSFDCQAVQEIPMQECLALVTLYQSTNGDQWLDNSGWLVSGTPCSWYGVICLDGHVVELQLFYNELAGSLPPEIGNLRYLKSLYLDRNQLSGPLPAEIGNLTQLQVARWGGNQFSSIPVELFQLRNLIFLELWGNQLSGSIPAGLGELSNLQELRLNSNTFTGSIPAELGKLTKLTHLDLSHNQLSGSIPSELGGMTMLNELKLSFNQLTGPIPDEFGSLRNLYGLDLSYNQLIGAVPAELDRVPLAELRLWGNQLDGTISVSESGITTIDFRGVRFAIHAALAESVWPEVVKAQPFSSGGPGWDVPPEHIRFTIVAPREKDHVQLTRAGIAAQPQIMIFPTEEYAAMSELAKAQIDALGALLEARPAAPEKELPMLPLVNAAQVFHAQVQYLDFQNGQGVRFITQYSQDVTPIVNQNLFYTFQGLTSDGDYYVAVSTSPSAPRG